MLPRPEHPKPQFQREKWLNLNGRWSFAFDFSDSGCEKGWSEDPSSFDLQILVPFCPESRLSGVCFRDFIPAVWYYRRFVIPETWKGLRVFLHFGGVDYDCRAWVNGEPVGRHLGGAVSFAFEITHGLRSGENDLTVCARDDVRSGLQPRGKQSPKLESFGCHYTRTTGIWQTVWLEARPQVFIDSVWIVPDLDEGCFVLTPTICEFRQGFEFRATVLDRVTEVASVRSEAPSRAAVIKMPSPRPWWPDDPYLYGVRFELLEKGCTVDSVESYAGLRKFHIEGNRFFLNNKGIFLRLVLDQGFYPDGIWTAPSDGELKGDIERAQAVGFQGARLHQKVFEERFHYWADRLGYLTWAEFCDWGGDFGQPEAISNHRREWREAILRDRNHPSILAWTPFNETYRAAKEHPEIHRQTLREVADLTRTLDPTRPVNDTSGYVHVSTDIFTVHDYEQDADLFRRRFAALAPDERERVFIRFPELAGGVGYEGQPYVVDEYGGTLWDESPRGARSVESAEGAWGYGDPVETKADALKRIGDLTAVLRDHPHMAGLCYTQLTDVEQERNGLYTCERKLKFDAESLKRIFGAASATDRLQDGNG